MAKIKDYKYAITTKCEDQGFLNGKVYAIEGFRGTNGFYLISETGTKASCLWGIRCAWGGKWELLKEHPSSKKKEITLTKSNIPPAPEIVLVSYGEPIFEPWNGPQPQLAWSDMSRG